MKRTSHPNGFTLVELLAALAITTILLGATMSSILLASRAIPASTDASAAALAAARVSDQICGELETATLVVEQTATTLAFVVPPHGSDTTPERIRYSWSGVAGDPLLRQYNQGTAAAVLDNCYQFAVTPVISTSTESYSGVATEDSAESLVINDVAGSSLGSMNVTSSQSVGQYFAPPTFASGVVAWRPTRVTFLAKLSDVLGITNLATVLPDANFLPNGATCDTSKLLATLLTSSFTTQQMTLTQSPRLLPTSGLCFTLTYSLGLPASITVQNNQNAGLLNTSGSNQNWAYQSNKQLQATLYAKMTHAGPNQTMVSKYLTATGLSVRSSQATNPAVQASAQSLNHPEMLSAYWEAKFDKDPTKLDVNADGTTDCVVHGGGSFNMGSVSNSVWQANGAGLDSQPGDNFSRLTVIDVRCRGTSTGGWAGVSLNAVRNGSNCAPIGAKVTLQADGTQTATVWRNLSDSAIDTLVTAPYLPNQPVDLHLVIDPAFGSVGISVNGNQCGTYAYNLYSSSNSSQSVSLSSGGSAQFSYVRVREVMP